MPIRPPLDPLNPPALDFDAFELEADDVLWCPEQAEDHRRLRDAYALRRRIRRLETAAAGRSKEAARFLREPLEENDALHLIGEGRLGPWDLARRTRELHGEPISGLAVSTWVFSRELATELLTDLDAGRILPPVTFLAGVFGKQRDAGAYELLRAGLAARQSRFVGVRTHAKVAAWRVGEARYVCEGSLNLTPPKNLEQLALIRSEALYAFHRRWIAEVIGEAEETGRDADFACIEPPDNTPRADPRPEPRGRRRRVDPRRPPA